MGWLFPPAEGSDPISGRTDPPGASQIPPLVGISGAGSESRDEVWMGKWLMKGLSILSVLGRQQEFSVLEFHWDFTVGLPCKLPTGGDLFFSNLWKGGKSLSMPCFYLWAVWIQVAVPGGSAGFVLRQDWGTNRAADAPRGFGGFVPVQPLPSLLCPGALRLSVFPAPSWRPGWLWQWVEV